MEASAVGAVRRIVSALELHPEHDSLLEHSAAALHSFAQQTPNWPDGRRAISDNGGDQQPTRPVLRFRVRLICLGLQIRSCTYDSFPCKTAGIEALCSVMAASLQPARGKILVHACSALCALATHDDYRRKIAQAGGIRCIHQVLQDASLRTHTVLMQRSCLALNTLADTAELELAIAEAGCVELVLAVLQGHKMNAGVAAQACGALCAVTMSSTSNRERVARAGGGGMLLAVLEAHKGDAAGAK